MKTVDSLSGEDRAALLMRLLRERASGAVERCALSHGQQSLWFLNRLNPDSSAYNTAICLRLRSAVDAATLQRAFARLVDRHAALRTTYGTDGDAPAQTVLGYQATELEEIDATGWPEQALRLAVEAFYRRPFDLAAGPVARMALFRAGPQDAVLLMVIHHIARDGWSTDLMLKEFERLHIEETGGPRAELPALDASFSDFVAMEAQWLASPAGADALAHWRRELAGELPVLALPADRTRPAVRAGAGGSVQLLLPAPLTQQVRALARDAGVTASTVLLTAWVLLLHHHTRQRDILVGVPAFNRPPGRRFDGVVGYFVNPVVVRAALNPDATQRELLGAIHQRVLCALQHQGVPFGLLVRELKVPRGAGHPPLVQSMFNHVRVRDDTSVQSLALPGAEGLRGRFAGLDIEPYPIAQEEGQFDLGLDLVERQHTLHATLKFDSGLFETATIERMAQSYAMLLEGLVREPLKRIRDTRALAPAAQRALAALGCGRSMPLPPVASIGRLLGAQAWRTPDAVAVTFGDDRLSYRELGQQVRTVARALRAIAPRPQLVGLCLASPFAQMVAVLGVLDSGSAFVPLDPAYPGERLAFIVRDAGVALLIGDAALPAAMDGHGVRVCDFDSLVREGAQEPDFDDEPDGDTLAYVNYTSGSTGQPKGVRIAHRSVVNIVQSMKDDLEAGPQDSLLMLTSLSFDIAMLEILLPLATGGVLVLAQRALARDPAALAARLDESALTMMQATPTTWSLLVEAGWRGRPGFKVLCGGEALPRPLADALLERTGCVWNLYGPTETTIWSLVDRVRPHEARVPIGRPIDNTLVEVLDECGRPVPIGVIGELRIGGYGVACGYHQRVELTAQRFAADAAGARRYATGDLAAWRADGRLDFFGRNDDQVKLHGHRIELGDIESTLAALDGIADAVVVRRGGQGAEARLVACCVPASTGPAPSVAAMRAWLAARLPAIMVPASFVVMDALPRTPNGKVDRKALAADQGDAPVRERAFRAPRDALESLVCELWGRVLGLERVGLDDNFFELGGGSLQCVALVAAAGRAGLRMSPEDVFRHQTAVALAAALAQRGSVVEDPLHAHDVPLKVPAELLAEHQQLARTPGRPAPATMVIESLGTYLPRRAVSTREVLDGCVNAIELDLERLTGIRNRRKTAAGEFSLDLAAAAVEDCLARSRHRAADIDLVIACNISRFDGERRVTFEPGSAVRLKRRFGFERALAFDISNACTGVFTGLAIADAMMRNGTIERALLVSGEYITHISDTAQREIDGLLDPRLACLTVGDAGAALLLERSRDGTTGFHDVDLFTLGAYSEACIARPSGGAHGGAIMLTDALAMTDVGLRQGLGYSLQRLVRAGMPVECFDHFLMHQTSSTTIRNAMREINRMFGREVCHAGNTIDNLAERGNTASTSHFVALMDEIRRERVLAGERIFFSVSGSGITLGTAFYTLDDLPQRIRTPVVRGDRPPVPKRVAGTSAVRAHRPRVRFAGLGVASVEAGEAADSVALLAAAARASLHAAGREPGEADLLLHAGVYRSDFICEPAIAALVAGRIGANALLASHASGRRTLAFDVFSGGVGFLNACAVAAEFFAAGRAQRALVTAGDVDNNRALPGCAPAGIAERGVAVLLEPSETAGLGCCHFRDYTGLQEALQTHCTWDGTRTWLEQARAGNLDSLYIDCISEAVSEVLAQEGLALADLDLLIPPQISAPFVDRLRERLQQPGLLVVDSTSADGDLLTASTVVGVQQVFDRALARPGDLAMIVTVGSGLQVGCALYHF